MSMKEDRRCGTCRFAAWQYTAKGNIRRSIAGRCQAPDPKIEYRPGCVEIRMHRSAIWAKWYPMCPAWEPKE